MVTSAGLTARLTELEARRQAFEAAIQTVATGGQSVTIEGRTITRPPIGYLQSQLNITVSELNRLKRLMVQGSDPMPTVQFEQE